MSVVAPNPDVLAEAIRLRDDGDFEGAVAVCRALPQDPRTRYFLSHLLLTVGQDQEGWAHFDARNELFSSEGLGEPAPDYPEWVGQPLEGKSILVRREQGYGDQIQFARYVPRLVAMGARATLLTKPALARLFGSLGAEVVTEPPPPHDYWVNICSLAARFGGDIPSASYLPSTPPEALVHRFGVVWQGDPSNRNNVQRSFGPGVYEPLLSLPATPVALQPEHSGAADFYETARIIDQLDAVVTVDTSVAHLAGAMGRPVYIALSHSGIDWRWLRGRSDSPWYPTARLYRQGPDLDWTPVIEAIRFDLAKTYA